MKVWRLFRVLSRRRSLTSVVEIKKLRHAVRFIIDNAIVVIVNAIHILHRAFQYVNSTCWWISAIVPLDSDLTIDWVPIVVETNSSLYIAADKIILIKSQIAIYKLTDVRV